MNKHKRRGMCVKIRQQMRRHKRENGAGEKARGWKWRENREIQG